MVEKKRSLIPGFIIVALGVVLLLYNMRVIPHLEELLGGLFFLAIAYICLRIFKNRPRQIWALLVGMFSFFLGVVLLCKTVNLLRGDLLGAVFFWCIAFAFACIFYQDKQKWWSIIPAGTCITLGAIALLDALKVTPGDYNGVVFFLGIGLTFVYLWTLANAANKLRWARFPAIACLFMAIYIYFEIVAHVGFDVLVAGALILAGLFFIVRAFKR